MCMCILIFRKISAKICKIYSIHIIQNSSLCSITSKWLGLLAGNQVKKKKLQEGSASLTFTPIYEQVKLTIVIRLNGKSTTMGQKSCDTLLNRIREQAVAEH